jgi:hypothetical protein
LRARRLLGGVTARPVRDLPAGQAAVAGAGGGAGQSP